MRFTIDTDKLNDALLWVARAIPERPQYPVLGHVLLWVSSTKLTLTGFDLSIGIQSSIDLIDGEFGSVLLPIKLLSNIIKYLPNGEITFENGDDNTVTITSASGKYQIRGLSPEEYPTFPTAGANTLQIPVESFLKGAKAGDFCSTDETKQVLTGIHLKVKTDGFEFASTDGHTLMVVEPEVVEGEELEEFEATIPGKAFKEVERMIDLYTVKDKDAEPLTINYSESQLTFEYKGQTVTCRILGGGYPLYKTLIPSKFECLVTCDRRSLIGCLERVGVVASKKNNIVKCTFDHLNQQISLTAEAADVGNALESLPVQISSEEPKEIAFNVKYWLKGLKKFESNEITLQLNSSRGPASVVPLGGIKMVYLVMPIQIRD